MFGDDYKNVLNATGSFEIEDIGGYLSQPYDIMYKKNVRLKSFFW